jgi:hypothetical protein
VDYFYDGQIKKYIVQIQRALSGFQYTHGKNADGTRKLRTVPVTYAPQDRLVASILKNNSENTILSTPSISVYITQIEPSNERRQIPNHVDTLSVVEREIDTSTNKYTVNRGRSYTVERFMPVPYMLTVQADIWTSSMDQKCEIMEQVLVLFNPAIDIQTNTNAVDWSALTTMTMSNTNWSSRSIPIGTSFDIDIASLTFEVPIWLNPPAKVTKEKIIEQIVANITALDPEAAEENRDFDNSAIDWSRGEIYARDITTPGDHRVSLEGGSIRLLTPKNQPYNNLGETWNWFNLFELYGKYRPGISQIRLKTTDDLDDIESDVVGTIVIDDEDPTVLQYTIDISTLPMNNLPAITGIVDPDKSWPGAETNPLPTPQVGDRYLLVNPIRVDTFWGGIRANTNDIIEYSPTGEWEVVFDSEFIQGNYTVLNTRTDRQLSWTDKTWKYTLAGEYGPGYWRIAL